MLKVLIVDDEANICSLIRNLVDWEGLNLEYAAERYNGQDALEYIRESKPDIVITDVRMPEMDGLELLKKASSLYRDAISFIIISGYKQFDYAYEAIKHGVVDFLLKPINGDELNATLKRLILMREGVAPGALPEALERDHILKKQFLINLLYGTESIKKGDIARINAEYRYKFKEERFLACAVQIDNAENMGQVKPSVMAKLTEQYTGRLAKYCFDAGHFLQNNTIWFILNYPAENSNDIRSVFNPLFSELKGQVKNYPLVQLTLCLGTEEDFAGMAKSMGAAQNAMRGRAILGSDRIIDYSVYEAQPLAKWSGDDKYREGVERAAELVDKIEMLRIIDYYFAEAAPGPEVPPHLILERHESMLRYILAQLYTRHAPRDMENVDWDATLINYDLCNNAKKLVEFIKKTVGDAFDKVLEIKLTQESKIVKVIKQYVEQNYAEQITLEDVSRHVFLSPSYCGTLFKKETGELFSKHLTRVRMEKAKEMLKGYNYSVKEIADIVGFKDFRYFSKLFKNYVGVKPTDYRKLYRLDSGT